jgi:hypothetical protein
MSRISKAIAITTRALCQSFYPTATPLHSDLFMAEWLILLLVVTAIVVPVVLLVGFAGCVFTRGSPPAPTTVLQQTLDSDSSGINGDGWAHYTLVLRIEPSAWMSTGLTQASWVQLELHAPSTGGSAINRIYISRHNGTNLYDSLAADLTKVFDVDDPPQPPLIIASDTVMVDKLAVNYPLDLTQPLLIAVDFGLSSAVASKGSVSGVTAYWKQGVSEAKPPNPNGARSSTYTPEAERLYLIDQIVVG